MLERALPIPQIALGERLRTRGRRPAREFVRGFWNRGFRNRAKQLLRALVDFFADGGPLS